MPNEEEKKYNALYTLYDEAWRERDSLKAENAKLREALGKIANGEGIYGQQAGEYKAIARSALAEAEKGTEPNQTPGERLERQADNEIAAYLGIAEAEGE